MNSKVFEEGWFMIWDPVAHDVRVRVILQASRAHGAKETLILRRNLCQPQIVQFGWNFAANFFW
jgi:hypothetical protein